MEFAPTPPAEGPPEPVRSLYIHVPFCFHKCHYCDFYSIVDPRDRQEAFTSRLCGELAALAPWAAGRPLRTIFVGGGTPSLLRPELWRRLLRCLAESFDLSLMGRPHGIGFLPDGGGGPGPSPAGITGPEAWAARRSFPFADGIGQEPDATGEFTVECNPETVTPELMDLLCAGGVTRVSVGAQSFRREHLKTLERWHEPENVARAVAMARGAGIARQSVDLIFGIPGQTVAEWEDDLARAIALGTEHLSCYDLTYEPGTAMTRRLELGQFQPADEQTEVEMFNATLAMLRRAGLERYEVSNYARPGAECRHNLAYWRQEQWLAAGPSASAHLAGHRWKNIPRLDTYLSESRAGLAPIADHELPDPRRALTERIMTGLRLAEGLDAGAVKKLAGPTGAARLDGLARSFARRGLVKAPIAALSGAGPREPLVGERWTLTDAGFLLADGIAAEFMAAV